MVDSFSTMAIESGLMARLPGLFSTDKISPLDDKVVKKIAAESPDTQAERTALQNKLTTLSGGLESLKRFGKNSIPNGRSTADKHGTILTECRASQETPTCFHGALIHVHVCCGPL